MTGVWLKNSARNFLRDESGVGTIWALTWLVLLFGIGGLAVDVTDVFRTKTMLQSTADAAALSGAIDLPKNSTQTYQTAVVTAVNMAYKNMHLGDYGTVLMPGEVGVGDWDRVAKTLVPKAGKFPTAVMVTTRRDEVNENPVGLNFLRIVSAVGAKFDHWNVYAQATAERFIPECILRQGLIARGIVDMQSNNVLRGDLCIHAEDHVEVNNNNVFKYKEGVTVSMPDKSDIIVADWSKNDGLAEALRAERLDPKMVDHVGDILATLRQPSLDSIDERSDIVPSYIADKSDGAVVNLTKAQFDVTELIVASLATPGPRKIYNVSCTGNQQITLDLTGNAKKNAPVPVIMQDFVLVTSCRINVGTDIMFSNVVLASDGGNDNVNNANVVFGEGDILGRPDACLDGGGVQIFSTSNVRSPAKLTMHGVQIVAAGDISVAAQAQGLNGINFQAGGDIDIASNNDLGAFGVCQGNAPDLQVADYFRLVY